MTGAGGADLAGDRGGEETAGGLGARGAGAALAGGSGATTAGLTTLEIAFCSATLTKHENTPSGLSYFARSFWIRGDRKEPRGFLVSPRPVSRCAICKNISVLR